jgi:ADP-ribosyl-[dinitrogen reductase] hydrolase
VIQDQEDFSPYYYPRSPVVEETVKSSSHRRNKTAPKATGYCLDTLRAAMWASSHVIHTTEEGESFEKMVLTAVNLGDDADSVGAVAGALEGARWGYSGIPQHLIDGLQDAEHILELAEKLVLNLE